MKILHYCCALAKAMFWVLALVKSELVIKIDKYLLFFSKIDFSAAPSTNNLLFRKILEKTFFSETHPFRS